MPETHILINLSFVGGLRSSVGRAKDDMSVPIDSTIFQLIASLEQRHPALSGLLDRGIGIERGKIVIFINGRNIAHDDGVATLLTQGDKVVLTKPIGGG